MLLLPKIFMSKTQTQIRPAEVTEAARLLDIAQAAQEKLMYEGSAQQIAGYSAQNVRERTQRGELFVLELAGSVIGSAFVEPVTPKRFSQIAAWDAVPDDISAWFLYGLVIHPEHQGQKWGQVLLHDICRQEKFASPAMLLLDCWAGNAKLRCFYADAGFALHGVFPEEDFEVAVFRWQQRQKSPNQP